MNWVLLCALKLLRDVTLTKFDGTVEIHINTVEKGLRGSVQLPHGTGREVRVKIADDKTIDAIVESINGGKIDFDVLIAHPGVMSKLARVARILGPKGLMPNPKSGTISPTPEKVADKMSKGEIQWKTEADFPLIHQVLGKLSFKDEQLQDNFKALVKSIDQIKISKITIKSTMSPGIKVEL
ncbi:MAG: 50S ribosomal protein L1 [Candidatus Gottesmanbacteria bacterium GW2011_GWC2_39_8]|uniref:Ribosomal protein n=1 Tax=Candidatus Gottesmanbacteria bacterium GW2011_GWC2_39_8 TaxID=1618450 RepID=A0A0G0PP43_9BACT|nr:MAG: 50S ribosomal protein L1 [Candidatus Gottesmanbacteria bacterium GW2011_GWC2_39_8]